MVVQPAATETYQISKPGEIYTRQAFSLDALSGPEESTPHLLDDDSDDEEEEDEDEEQEEDVNKMLVKAWESQVDQPTAIMPHFCCRCSPSSDEGSATTQSVRMGWSRSEEHFPWECQTLLVKRYAPDPKSCPYMVNVFRLNFCTRTQEVCRGI